MTDASSLPPDTDRRAKRNVAVLVAAQSVLGSQMPIHFVLGGLSGQLLATNKCLATLPISLTMLGSMISAPILANIMQRYGRRSGFLIGASGGTIGGLLCVLGLLQGSFPLFLFGSFFIGVYMSAQGFYRFAAADTASDAFRPKAISWVMAGGLLSAFIGPSLVNWTKDGLDPVPFAGAYVAIIALNLIGAMFFFLLDIDKPKAPIAGESSGRSRMELLKTPRILVAMICAMVSYSLMNLVMTSTPLAVVGCGFETETASDIVRWHVIAMFAPAFFTGNLIARFSAERVIAAGLVILTGAGVVALMGVDLMNFYGALILLGVGWNFGFIGGTAMLASAHTPAERGRVQGMNDFAVFGLVTIASLASGGLMNCSGGTPVEGWNAVNYAMIPFLTLAGGALIWFAAQGRRVS